MTINNDACYILANYNTKSINILEGNKLRIYLDTKNDLKSRKDLANMIISIFDNTSIYSLLSFYGSSKNMPKEIIESLKLRGLDILISKQSSKLFKKVEEGYIYNYYNKVDNKTIKKINKALIEKDHAVKPYLFLDCLYFNFNLGLIINIYDDRGMDLISDNKIILDDLYNKFKEKIKMEYI